MLSLKVNNNGNRATLDESLIQLKVHGRGAQGKEPPKLKLYSGVELTGIVSETVTKPGDNSNGTEYRIFCPNMGFTFEVVAVKGMFCPLRTNDTIYAYCRAGPDGKLYMSEQKPPFVQPAMDKNSIIQCFMRCLKSGFQQVAKIYSTLSKVAGGDENVIGFLTGISQHWNDTKDESILFMMDGIDYAVVKKLVVWWYKERNLRRLYLLGLTRKEINACRMTCEEIYQKCVSNPYTIPAIPIEKCDLILDRLNKKPDMDEKTRGMIVRMIWKNLNESGWTATPTKILSRNFPGIKAHVEALKNEYGMVAEMESAYLKFPHHVETYVANWITKLAKEDPIKYDTPVDEKITTETGQVIERCSAYFTKASLSEDQMKAIQGALDHKICIITGIGGTGKTTIINEIINNLELRGITYALCSFTGKAVARIRQVTKKRSPATIHRLIANTKTAKLDKNSSQFEKDIPYTNYEHVIIDEASMVTTELFYDFLKAYPDIKKITFCGDCNQLLPIGWGSLFSQLIKSETIPVYKLMKNFRVTTKDGSRDGIILNASAILTHEPPYQFEFVELDNFKIYEGTEQYVYDIIKGCYSSGIDVEDILVLSPYNQYLQRLNKNIQDIYNGGSKFVIDSRGITWRVNDKVMLVQNDPEIGVFNGETGIIKDITHDSIMVEFSTGIHAFLIEPKISKSFYPQPTFRKYPHKGTVVDEVLEGEDEDYANERTVLKLDLAYAITIDKSQGSEAQIVIFFIPEFNTGNFLNKNRIYTAISRAQSMCYIICPDIEALNIAATKNPSYRCENLHRRLSKELPNLKPFKVERKIIQDDNGDCPMMQTQDMIDYMDAGYDCDDFD